jgi:hypothetical protein
MCVTLSEVIIDHLYTHDSTRDYTLQITDAHRLVNYSTLQVKLLEKSCIDGRSRDCIKV